VSDGEQNIQSGRDTTQAGRDVTQIGGDKVGGDKNSPLHQRRAPVPDFVGRAEEYAGAVAHCQHADEEAMMHTMNPYVGPRSFQQGERLYGRDREVHDLAGLLVAERIVLLYSPSGAGKTSLIQAALIPRLTQRGFAVLPIIRINTESPIANTHTPTNRYVLSTRNYSRPLCHLAVMWYPGGMNRAELEQLSHDELIDPILHLQTEMEALQHEVETLRRRIEHLETPPRPRRPPRTPRNPRRRIRKPIAQQTRHERNTAHPKATRNTSGRSWCSLTTSLRYVPRTARPVSTTWQDRSAA
jgi:hypothetical protein